MRSRWALPQWQARPGKERIQRNFVSKPGWRHIVRRCRRARRRCHPPICSVLPTPFPPSKSASARASPSCCGRESLPLSSNARPPPISEVSSSSRDPTWQSTLGTRSGGGDADPMAEEDRKLHPDEEIESFFDQLWAIPSLPSHHQPRVPGSVGFLMDHYRGMPPCEEIRSN